MANKLVGIYLENFQSIRKPTYLSLENLTFLVGPNSAGKSTILDALQIIRSSIDINKGPLSIGQNLRSSTRNQKASAIGVEIKIEKPNYKNYYRDIEKNRRDSEFERFYDSAEYEPGWDFLEKLNHCKIQLEINTQSDNSRTGLKIAIDHTPIFEMIEGIRVIHEKTIVKDENYDDEKSDEYDYLRGGIKLYKTHPEFHKILNRIDETFQANPLYQLVIEENEEQMIIWGLELSVDGEVFTTYVSNAYYNFFEIWYLENTNETDSNNFYSRITSLLQDISFIIEGIFWHIRQALNYTHVKGDRNILDSNVPFYIFEGTHYWLESYIKHNNANRSLSRYAANLDGKVNSGLLPFTFVKDCFSKYMPSLRNFSVVSESCIIRKKTEKGKYNRDGELIFLKVKEKGKAGTLKFEEVGSGVSFTLPIFTALWFSPIVFVEQPELHLHPKAQCDIGDVFISATNLGCNAIIETHSEHILLRVLRRIRETTVNAPDANDIQLKCEKLNIYYFEPKGNGFTDVKKIRVDRFGELLDLWPGGFFSEREGELFNE